MDDGQIVGRGLISGQERAFLLSPAQAPEPVPEPTTLLLLGTGLAGAGAAVRKRRQATKREERIFRNADVKN